MDVFQALFHPAGRGTISDWIARAVWTSVRAAAKRYPGVITYAGPVAFVCVIGSWIVLVVIGPALIFWPQMTAAFVPAPGLEPGKHSGFFDALNTSLGSLTNVSTELHAKEKWVRLLMNLEGIVGFGLLTASVSWLLSLYPVLGSKRSLAQQASLLHWAEIENDVDLFSVPASESVPVLMSLTAQLTTLRSQVIQLPITYYFHVGEEEGALAGILPYLAELAVRSTRAGRPASLRLAGTSLGGAVDSYLEMIATIFLRIPTDDKGAILRRHADDQLRRMVVGRAGRRAA